MVTGIIARKLGMTQVFSPDGTLTPATVVKAGPLPAQHRYALYLNAQQ